MATVKLRYKWFAPTDKVRANKIFTHAGRRFPAGVVEVPDELVKYLPSTAIVLKGKHVDEEPKTVEQISLIEADEERAAEDASRAAYERAEKNLKERRQEQMAQARAAKAAKEKAAKE